MLIVARGYLIESFFVAQRRLFLPCALNQSDFIFLNTTGQGAFESKKCGSASNHKVLRTNSNDKNL
jgi:hypothetical protein